MARLTVRIPDSFHRKLSEQAHKGKLKDNRLFN